MFLTVQSVVNKKEMLNLLAGIAHWLSDLIWYSKLNLVSVVKSVKRKNIDFIAKLKSLMKSSKNRQQQYGNASRKGGSSKREKGSKYARLYMFT